jgi:hypothetical protein
MDDHEGLDSDDLIPPKLHTGPHSLVPFSKSPLSMALSPPPSATIGTSIGRTSAATSAPGSAGGPPGSAGAPASSGGLSIRPMGSGAGSLGSPRDSSEQATLPQMPWKDWELNLDALAVELNEDGTEVELGKGAFGVVVKGTYRRACMHACMHAAIQIVR